VVKSTDGTAKEESKETMGFVAEESKGDSVPFGTRLCGQSLVCYTFIKKLCGSRGYSQFFDIIILLIRDVRLSQKEVCGYIKVLCNLGDIPVTEHLSLAFQVAAERTFRKTDDACQLGLGDAAVFD